MLHVGMNIEDKNQMMSELARVCRNQGTVVIYDVTTTKAGDLPTHAVVVNPQFSFPEPASSYEAAAKKLVFNAEFCHYDLALKFFNEPQRHHASLARTPNGSPDVGNERQRG